tara:strand:+ start:872 stop:1216 length:345 start_codon:yes stop_codon:yes gene_type:complete
MSDQEPDNLVRLRTKERGPSRLVQEPNMRDIMRSIQQPGTQTALESIITGAVALRDAHARGELASIDPNEVDEAARQIKFWADSLPRHLIEDRERASEGKGPKPMVGKVGQTED